jgi:uncharacterized membrane protein
MKPRTTSFVTAAIVAATVAIALWLYPSMPDRVVSHWDAAGNPNGYMGKFWGVFLAPVMMVGFWGLFLALPLIDPLRANIAKFRASYNAFIVGMMAFFAYIEALVLYWNTGHSFDMTRAIVPAIAGLWYVIGILLVKSKRNWFIGVRTPWTLSNDVVWDKTNALAGKLFKVAAVVAFVGMFFPRYLAVLVVVPAIGIALGTAIYSYILYSRLERSGAAHS